LFALNNENVKLVIFLGALVVLVFTVRHFHSIQSVEMAPVNVDCDLQQTSCTTQFLNGANVTFTFSPSPVKPAEYFIMEVKTDYPEVKSVQVDFHSVTMNMGFYRPELQQQSAGLYQGKGILSACTVDKMYWEATVMLETNEGIFAAPFQFVASGKVE